MDAAAIPFPSDETTPPVTNMYLAIVIVHLVQIDASNSRGHPFQILRRIHAQRFVFGFHHANAIAVFERAQLLQPLGLFERTDRQIGIAQQKIAPVHIQADMFEVSDARPPLAHDKEWGSAKNKWRCRRDP